MLISYKWLQGYFEEKLPEPEKLAELITFSFAEIENVTQTNADTILDIKVLPDRACYTLSHRGVAYEVSAITGLKKKVFEWPQPEISKVRDLKVRVEATDLCGRYIARVIENITPKGNEWVTEHLGAMGQKLINPIVDGANLVMFDRGQPLHAFDADKVVGDIVVRLAKQGEKIVTLDNREVALDEKVLIIADDSGPLAIAGIKGGKKAEVTTNTKNLILESANFDASNIRKTSERLGIRTDASKRFENKFSPALASKGMEDFSAYLFEMDKNIKVGKIIDQYPKPLKALSLKVEKEALNSKLGIALADKDVEEIFSRLLFEFKKEEDGWLVTPPVFRADLSIPEDIAEEVGRLYGYDKIPAILPLRANGVEIPKSFYYEWKIRQILTEAGFSEVMTSSFSNEGDIAIEKPLAEDKRYARPDLFDNFSASLSVNSLNAPLFGSDAVKIFEIGRVFAEDGEHTALVIGFAGPKKKIAFELDAIVKHLSEKLGVEISGETKDGIFEFNLDSIFPKLPEPKEWDITLSKIGDEKFKQFSLYPFIVRDVAVFVPQGVGESEVEKIILAGAGSLVVKHYLFDRFERPARPGEHGGEGKISYAFRLIFQSMERTLTDEEVNKNMEKVTVALSEQGWQVR